MDKEKTVSVDADSSNLHIEPKTGKPVDSSATIARDFKENENSQENGDQKCDSEKTDRVLDLSGLDAVSDKSEDDLSESETKEYYERISDDDVLSGTNDVDDISSGEDEIFADTVPTHSFTDLPFVPKSHFSSELRDTVKDKKFDTEENNFNRKHFQYSSNVNSENPLAFPYNTDFSVPPPSFSTANYQHVDYTSQQNYPQSWYSQQYNYGQAGFAPPVNYGQVGYESSHLNFSHPGHENQQDFSYSQDNVGTPQNQVQSYSIAQPNYGANLNATHSNETAALVLQQSYSHQAASVSPFTSQAGNNVQSPNPENTLGEEKTENKAVPSWLKKVIEKANQVKAKQESDTKTSSSASGANVNKRKCGDVSRKNRSASKKVQDVIQHSNSGEIDSSADWLDENGDPVKGAFDYIAPKKTVDSKELLGESREEHDDLVQNLRKVEIPSAVTNSNENLDSLSSLNREHLLTPAIPSLRGQIVAGGGNVTACEEKGDDEQKKLYEASKNGDDYKAALQAALATTTLAKVTPSTSSLLAKNDVVQRERVSRFKRMDFTNTQPDSLSQAEANAFQPQKTAAEAALESQALTEILTEVKQGAARAKQYGALGWQKNPVPVVNKTFLHNTLVSTLREPYKPPSKRGGRSNQGLFPNKECDDSNSSSASGSSRSRSSRSSSSSDRSGSSRDSRRRRKRMRKGKGELNSDEEADAYAAAYAAHYGIPWMGPDPWSMYYGGPEGWPGYDPAMFYGDPNAWAEYDAYRHGFHNDRGGRGRGWGRRGRGGRGMDFRGRGREMEFRGRGGRGMDFRGRGMEFRGGGGPPRGFPFQGVGPPGYRGRSFSRSHSRSSDQRSRSGSPDGQRHSNNKFLRPSKSLSRNVSRSRSRTPKSNDNKSEELPSKGTSLGDKSDDENKGKSKKKKKKKKHRKSRKKRDKAESTEEQPKNDTSLDDTAKEGEAIKDTENEGTSKMKDGNESESADKKLKKQSKHKSKGDRQKRRKNESEDKVASQKVDTGNHNKTEDILSEKVDKNKNRDLEDENTTDGKKQTKEALTKDEERDYGLEEHTKRGGTDKGQQIDESRKGEKQRVKDKWREDSGLQTMKGFSDERHRKRESDDFGKDDVRRNKAKGRYDKHLKKNTNNEIAGMAVEIDLRMKLKAKREERLKKGNEAANMMHIKSMKTNENNVNDSSSQLNKPVSIEPGDCSTAFKEGRPDEVTKKKKIVKKKKKKEKSEEANVDKKPKVRKVIVKKVRVIKRKIGKTGEILSTPEGIDVDSRYLQEGEEVSGQITEVKEVCEATGEGQVEDGGQSKGVKRKRIIKRKIIVKRKKVKDSAESSELINQSVASSSCEAPVGEQDKQKDTESIHEVSTFEKSTDC